MKNWIDNITSNDDMVLSSRVRLARNITGVAFPHKLELEEAKALAKNIEDTFYEVEKDKGNFKDIDLWKVDLNQGRNYIEKHLISPNLLASKDKSAFLLSEDETISLMINEEDHLRIQCISSGFDIREAYKIANRIDDDLEEKLDFAFDDNLGYITACPTNLGTGMRVSAMLHLPALTMKDEINDALKALTQLGMTLRGLYGEGSKAEGNIYQVSNQITLGMKEEDILSNLEAVVSQLISQENRAREQFLGRYKNELEDKIYRSLGILKSSRILSSKEALDLLSNVRMGIEMEILKDVDKVKLNKLLVETQPATLQLRIGRDLSVKERDIERANLVREYFNNK
ncbi:protein arginine kinase [Clostridium algidicarnis]|uniref:protein arginine kinase n=1 Tax=Clostridium algidicarnis TaxID=37659 RepID=UPI001C0BF22A|nr:protein arginine kinase [Clostridium algidicarnis]MBU3196881.1 protein arginine kinase [Clostridium algidicarnis]